MLWGPSLHTSTETYPALDQIQIKDNGLTLDEDSWDGMGDLIA